MVQTQLALRSIWLTSRGQWVSHTSGKKQEMKQRPKTILKLACWNICTMQDSDEADRPRRLSALVAQKLEMRRLFEGGPNSNAAFNRINTKINIDLVSSVKVLF